MPGTTKRTAPELLSPAGDKESLAAAIGFGADAVYIGGKRFGMRAAPKNFDFEQIADAVNMAHDNGVKLYLTCNTTPRNEEIRNLPDFLINAATRGVDALIVADLGVLSYAKKYAPGVAIHISTQAGVANYAAACSLYELGAKRVIMAREVPLTDIAEIRRRIPKDMEIECFVHGSMCVSYSGRCLLSNYLADRDSNRGDCAQPCRWKYRLEEETRPGEYLPVEEDADGTYIFNSKDMCMIEHIHALTDAGVNSFKIEGRAKSAYYTAVVTNAYRSAIDGWKACPSPDYKPEQWIVDELVKISNREYCTGFYFDSPNRDARIFYEGGYRRLWEVAAVAESWEAGRLTAVQRNRFFENETLEILEPGRKPFEIKVEELEDEEGHPILSAHRATMKVSFRCGQSVRKGALLRKKTLL